MEIRTREFCSVLGILLLFACISSRTEAAFDSESFQQKLVALQKVLNYMNDRPEQMNLDATFVVTLTEANLVAALLHENVQYLEDKFFIALKEMVVLSDLTRRNLITTLASENETESLMLTTLCNPNLWIKPITWTKVLLKSRSSTNQVLSYRETVRSILYGTPTTTEIEHCLIKIVRTSVKEECKIPVTCIAMLMKEDNTTGYRLTHRLLMVQIAEALGCEQVKTESLLSLVPVYCTKILQDLVNLEAWNFPSVGHDLMMEQIVLCGMEGYYEFVDKHYEDLILSWPHWSGCFGFFGFSNEHKITRRSTSTTDFGCENHTTGLAAASLAIFIRENIENIFNQP